MFHIFQLLRAAIVFVFWKSLFDFFFNVQYGAGVKSCPTLYAFPVKVIPQKLNLPMNFFETFPESSLLSTVSKKTIKMIGHHSRLRDMMGQSYPIYACTYILLTKRKGRTERISARGLDSTDRAQRGPYKKDRGPIFSEQAWLIRDLLHDWWKQRRKCGIIRDNARCNT